jgi:hypothetical protein
LGETFFGGNFSPTIRVTQGPMLCMIFKIFSPKNLAKNWRFWLKAKPNFEKN